MLAPCLKVALPAFSEFLGKPDQKPAWPAYIAEPVGIFIANDIADGRRAAFFEFLKRCVDIVNGEHYTQIAQSVYRSVSMIVDGDGRDVAAQFQPAVTVWRTHHGDLHALA